MWNDTHRGSEGGRGEEEEEVEEEEEEEEEEYGRKGGDMSGETVT